MLKHSSTRNKHMDKEKKESSGTTSSRIEPDIHKMLRNNTMNVMNWVATRVSEPTLCAVATYNIKVEPTERP